MGLLKKRSFAACVLALSAALSIVVGGGGKLRRERVGAEEAFFHGTAGFSVYNDLMELRETGYNILHICESVSGAEAETRSAASAWAMLDKAETPEDLASASVELYEAVGELEEKLAIEDPALAERWERQVRSFYESISHLQFDSYYDEQAAAYNRLLDDPLCEWLGDLTGNGKMPSFKELF